ncbi:MAG TPA: hypothetical protein VH333_02900 [Pseudonocardiaceae bacterium]|jgi:hypothetical protein|nr:hypothetical protein [Pseudonocardiaceae bacterium]
MSEIKAINIDPEVSRHRGRNAALARAGRHEEAREAARDTQARLLLLAARRAAGHQPALTSQQVDEIIEVLRGTAA